jgi:integrase
MSANVYDEKWQKNLMELIVKHPNYYLREFVNFNTKLAYKSLHGYVYAIIRFMDDIRKPVRNIGFDDYTNYMASIREMSPSGQIVIYSALKKYSKYLYVSGKTDKDYMESIERPNATERQSTISKREKGFLSDEEIPKYLQNVRNAVGYREAKYWKERDMLLVQLFLNTGLRCSGVWKLDVSDIDFENHMLTTTEKRGKVKSYVLTDELIDLINEWLEARDSRAIKGEEALFVSERGTRLSIERIAEIIHAYASNIDGKNITPHKLRATFGTQVYSATKDIYLTQTAMGHKSPQTTELYIRGQANKSMMVAADIMRNITLKNFA